MPYIDQSRRQAIQSGASLENAGELNYAITTLVSAYLNHKQISYQTLNDAMGALEGAKLELYRRVIASYENTKISSNGDVY